MSLFNITNGIFNRPNAATNNLKFNLKTKMSNWGDEVDKELGPVISDLKIESQEVEEEIIVKLSDQQSNTDSPLHSAKSFEELGLYPFSKLYNIDIR